MRRSPLYKADRKQQWQFYNLCGSQEIKLKNPVDY